MISNISFLNFKSQLNPINNNSSKVLNFNIKAPKLAPLAQDTISFTGLSEYKAAFNNIEICKRLHENAQPANQYLQSVLDKYFSQDVYDENNNPNGIIAPIQARVKSPESIEEKVSDKISSAFRQTNESKFYRKIFSPHSEKGIKENIRDISGARIVVTEAQGNVMDRVVDNLCRMIRHENLVIEEIENHISPEEGSASYFTDAQLKKIEDAVNDVRSDNGLEGIDFKIDKTKTGYMALHLSVDTRYAPKFYKNQGFWSELQIIGSDVELLKEIEDFCYKLKKGMSIHSADIAYKPFEEMFLNAYNDTENYPDVKEAFRQYTIKAYLAQKDRLPSGEAEDDTTNWAYRYPTIKDCGFEGKIPPILDFNILARIKRDCDDLHNVEVNSEKIMSNIN